MHSSLQKSSNTTHSRQNSTLHISNTDSSSGQLYLQHQSTKSPSTTTGNAIPFIWDEASMLRATALKAVDPLLRNITNVNRVFGSKYFMHGGDFRQILPVNRKAGRERAVQKCLKSRNVKDLLYHFQQLRLITKMRAVQDKTYQAFSDWLLRVGNGVEPDDHQDQINLP
eukprot:gene2240-biopygen2003